MYILSRHPLSVILFSLFVCFIGKYPTTLSTMAYCSYFFLTHIFSSIQADCQKLLYDHYALNALLIGSLRHWPSAQSIGREHHLRRTTFVLHIMPCCSLNPTSCSIFVQSFICWNLCQTNELMQFNLSEFDWLVNLVKIKLLQTFLIRQVTICCLIGNDKQAGAIGNVWKYIPNLFAPLILSHGVKGRIWKNFSLKND